MRAAKILNECPKCMATKKDRSSRSPLEHLRTRPSASSVRRATNVSETATQHGGHFIPAYDRNIPGENIESPSKANYAFHRFLQNCTSIDGTLREGADVSRLARVSSIRVARTRFVSCIDSYVASGAMPIVRE